MCNCISCDHVFRNDKLHVQKAYKNVGIMTKKNKFTELNCDHEAIKCTCTVLSSIYSTRTSFVCLRVHVWYQSKSIECCISQSHRIAVV